MKTRFFYNDSTNLEDFSTQLNNYQQGSAQITMLSNHALYIGQECAFNHLYFKLSQLNINPADLTVKLWDGTVWREVAELIDETNGFTESGFLTWTPNKDETSWSREDTDEGVTGLEDVKVYDLFWIQITSSADLSQLTLDWVGQKFCEDEDLYSLYPLLMQSNMKTAFTPGKTDWEEQIAAASREIVRDLVRAGVISDSGNVLRRDLLLDACIHKTAEIVFRPFGDDYDKKKVGAHGDYKAALNLKRYKTDKNNNAILDSNERRSRTGFLTR